MKFTFYFTHFQVPNTTRHHRQNRGRMNSVGKAQSGVYIPQLQHYYQPMDSRVEYLAGLLLFLHPPVQKLKALCITLFVFGIVVTFLNS